MNGPEAFVQHLADEGYHPRSNKHGNFLSRAILEDIVAHCPAFAKRARAGEIVAKLNGSLQVGPKRRNVDLLVGPPPGFAVPPSDGSIQMDVPATVELALEAKALMTEHLKARHNRLGDLEAVHETVHRYDENTIAVGVVTVNVSDVFFSQTRGKIHSHKNITQVGRRTVDLFRTLPLRHDPGTEPGFEAVSVIVVDFDNLAQAPADEPAPSRATLIYKTPAPPAGDPLHYATMIRRICKAYETRWATSKP